MFGVQAGFGIEEIKASYLAGLNSKHTSVPKQKSLLDKFEQPAIMYFSCMQP